VVVKPAFELDLDYSQFYVLSGRCDTSWMFERSDGLYNLLEPNGIGVTTLAQYGTVVVKIEPAGEAPAELGPGWHEVTLAVTVPSGSAIWPGGLWEWFLFRLDHVVGDVA
jgi:hypothetical protein